MGQDMGWDREGREREMKKGGEGAIQPYIQPIIQI